MAGLAQRWRFQAMIRWLCCSVPVRGGTPRQGIYSEALTSLPRNERKEKGMRVPLSPSGACHQRPGDLLLPVPLSVSTDAH